MLNKFVDVQAHWWPYQSGTDAAARLNGKRVLPTSQKHPPRTIRDPQDRTILPHLAVGAKETGRFPFAGFTGHKRPGAF